MAGVKCGKCKARHATVDDVRACYQGQAPAAFAQPGDEVIQVTAYPPATDAQRSFLASLAKRKGVEVPTVETRKEASAAIDELKALADAPVPEAVEMTEDELMEQLGVYVLPDGTIVQVKPNRQKTRCYAKRWVAINGERLTLSDEHVKGEWAYAPGLMAKVKPEYRMTLEQAKRFILIYGQCCRCGRKLKAAKSVEQGIGPVCIKYFGGALALA